jgi:hypothetical protein
MRTHDPDRLFASADPAAGLDLTASLEAVWERVGAQPAADPPSRPLRWARRRTRRHRGVRIRRLRAVLVVAVAAVIAAAMALLPATDREHGAGGIPAPVQAFADDLTGRGVLHVVTERAGAVNALGALTPLPPLRTESWYALDGSAWRTRLSTGATFGEHVFDGSTLRAYNLTCGPLLTPSGPAPAPVVPRLLDLDREVATGEARVLGQALIRGTPAYNIGYDVVPGDLHAFDWHLFVSTERARLLRIEQLDLARPLIRQRSEVPTFEVLPPSRRSARLLLPSPHLRGVPQALCG